MKISIKTAHIENNLILRASSTIRNNNKSGSASIFYIAFFSILSLTFTVLALNFMIAFNHAAVFAKADLLAKSYADAATTQFMAYDSKCEMLLECEPDASKKSYEYANKVLERLLKTYHLEKGDYLIDASDEIELDKVLKFKSVIYKRIETGFSKDPLQFIGTTYYLKKITRK